MPLLVNLIVLSITAPLGKFRVQRPHVLREWTPARLQVNSLSRAETAAAHGIVLYADLALVLCTSTNLRIVIVTYEYDVSTPACCCLICIADFW